VPVQVCDMSWHDPAAGVTPSVMPASSRSTRLKPELSPAHPRRTHHPQLGRPEIRELSVGRCDHFQERTAADRPGSSVATAKRRARGRRLRRTRPRAARSRPPRQPPRPAGESPRQPKSPMSKRTFARSPTMPRDMGATARRHENADDDAAGRARAASHARPCGTGQGHALAVSIPARVPRS
jgi:hypothetical protein